MQMQRAQILRKRTEHVATADLPLDYWFYGFRSNQYQSRRRPYRMAFRCDQNKDGSGNKIYADTGEYFVDERSFMPDYMGVRTQLTQTNGQHNVFGGEMRPFTSVEGYLDGFVTEFFVTPPVRLLSSEFLDKTPAQVERDELEATQTLVRECTGMGPSATNWVAHRALKRTTIRYYETNTEDGKGCYQAVGAYMTGKDFLVYDAKTGIRVLRDDHTPFGKAPRGRAQSNFVLWGPTQRFAMTFTKSSVEFNEFQEVVRTFARSLSFTDKVWNDMNAEAERLAKNDHERMERETEASHQRLEQMKAEHARREAEHARREAERDRRDAAWAEQRAAERAASQARRDAWNRQQELDRRRRNAWSDAIRGVDRYEHPYDGGTLEVRAGYGHRAFYNPAEDRVITADSDIDIPFGYEELKRKDT